MSKSLWILVLVVVLGGGYMLLNGRMATEEPAVVEEEVMVKETAVEEDAAMVEETVIVSYTDEGFDPATLEVKVGTKVTFVNNSAGEMWVASAVHPTHELLPGFDQLEVVGLDGEYSYTFEEVGAWTFHNHVAPTFTGVVTVTE